MNNVCEHGLSWSCEHGLRKLYCETASNIKAKVTFKLRLKKQRVETIYIINEHLGAKRLVHNKIYFL